MLQNCSKLPLIAATMPTMHSRNCAYLSLLRTKMSTSSGDGLNLWHLQCRETASLHDHRDVQNREGTATAEPPQRTAESKPWAPVVTTTGMASTTCTTGASTTRKKLRSGVSMVFRTGKTMGIGLCTMRGMSTTGDERQQRAYHLDQELHLWNCHGHQQSKGTQHVAYRDEQNQPAHTTAPCRRRARPSTFTQKMREIRGPS